MKLENSELIKVVGGASISGTVVNAISRMIEQIMDVGRSLGTAIRMIYSHRSC